MSVAQIARRLLFGSTGRGVLHVVAGNTIRSGRRKDPYAAPLPCGPIDGVCSRCDVRWRSVRDALPHRPRRVGARQQPRARRSTRRRSRASTTQDTTRARSPRARRDARRCCSASARPSSAPSAKIPCPRRSRLRGRGGHAIRSRGSRGPRRRPRPVGEDAEQAPRRGSGPTARCTPPPAALAIAQAESTHHAAPSTAHGKGAWPARSVRCHGTPTVLRHATTRFAPCIRAALALWGASRSSVAVRPRSRTSEVAEPPLPAPLFERGEGAAREIENHEGRRTEGVDHRQAIALALGGRARAHGRRGFWKSQATLWPRASSRSTAMPCSSGRCRRL